MGFNVDLRGFFVVDWFRAVRGHDHRVDTGVLHLPRNSSAQLRRRALVAVHIVYNEQSDWLTNAHNSAICTVVRAKTVALFSNAMKLEQNFAAAIFHLVLHMLRNSQPAMFIQSQLLYALHIEFQTNQPAAYLATAFTGST